MSKFTHAENYKEAAAQYSTSEWLAQLAQDASELSQAALKYRKTLVEDGMYISETSDAASIDLAIKFANLNTSIINIIKPVDLARCCEGYGMMNKKNFVTEHNKHKVPVPDEADEDKVRRTLIIKTNSHEEEFAVAEKIHKQLVGNPDYINSDICVNMSKDRNDGTENEVHVVFFEAAKSDPELKI